LEKLEKNDFRLMVLALENLLEIYAETGMLTGSEKAIDELQKLRLKLIRTKSIS